ncbi:MAG: hypothetical protein JXA57_11510 [Armatimonadetes bacterium]|nr:hypothetical protein [Armatimonadota bacterium]
MSNVHDERVVATRQRWATHGFALLFVALPADLMVRIFVLKQDPRQWLDISVIWLATILYVGIGMTASGVAPYEGKWSTSWLAIVIIAVEVPVILALMGMVPTPAAFIAYMALAAASAFLVVILSRGVYSMWERRTLGRGPREE